MANTYITFEDERIKLLIPKQLRLKRGGNSYIFSDVPKHGRKDAHVILGIDIDPPPVLRKAARKTILKAPPHHVWMGAEMRTIRKGRCSFGDGGIEAIEESIIPKETGSITLYRWTILY